MEYEVQFVKRSSMSKLLLLATTLKRLNRLKFENLRQLQESQLSSARSLRKRAMAIPRNTLDNVDIIDHSASAKHQGYLLSRSKKAADKANILNAELKKSKNLLADSVQFERACETLLESANRDFASKNQRNEELRQTTLHLLTRFKKSNNTNY